MRITPAPPKITPEAVVSAMERYRDFYALNHGAGPQGWRDAVVALEQSLGVESGASACFLQLLEDITPDFGALQPLTDGIGWLGFIVGPSAAASSNEDATWAEDTPSNAEGLLARTEETS